MACPVVPSVGSPDGSRGIQKGVLGTRVRFDLATLAAGKQQLKVRVMLSPFDFRKCRPAGADNADASQEHQSV
jgi:hypothetical protein